MPETDEVVQTIERLQSAFEDLVVRGLRAAGPGQLTALEAMQSELERTGAGHLAGRIGALVTAVRNDDRAAAAALLRAQASLRVFERLLTQEVAADSLQALLPEEEGA
jgi:hypothetical protein